ncbi:hypothetical protein EV356DRAFT_505377 [Viridothelium virens]|uniref:Secreted peptide n=1 Tax=Viridothelium virens TaxID=1048519 RepID=A0A6A6H3D2_VIRVR|nr:hypothetical protein EV356DRAFT_505377 [Viridothelium virens]
MAVAPTSRSGAIIAMIARLVGLLTRLTPSHRVTRYHIWTMTLRGRGTSTIRDGPSPVGAAVALDLVILDVVPILYRYFLRS